MELETARQPGRPADVEARREPDDRAAIELDRRHDEVRAADPERDAIDRHAIGLEIPSPGPDRPCPPKHRRDQGQGIDADVDQHADVEERLGRGVPRLDAAPIHLGVHGPDRPEATAPDPCRGRLLCLAEERRRRAAKAESPTGGQLHELVRLARPKRERLLAVDVAAGQERPLRDLVVGVVDRQVQHDVDRRRPPVVRRPRRAPGSRTPPRTPPRGPGSRSVAATSRIPGWVGMSRA